MLLAAAADATLSFCSGAQSVFEGCGTDACPTGAEGPIDAEWSDWNGWGDCDCSGVKERSRNVKQHEKFGGHALSGVSIEAAECIPDNTACHLDWHPLACQPSPWSEWSTTCKCGTAQVYRKRAVAIPNQNCGAPCAAPLQETKSCDQSGCSEADDVDCQLTKWSAWGNCSKTCGGGQQLRSRVVEKGTQSNGKPCEPSLMETQGCNGNRRSNAAMAKRRSTASGVIGRSGRRAALSATAVKPRASACSRFLRATVGSGAAVLALARSPGATFSVATPRPRCRRSGPSGVTGPTAQPTATEGIVTEHGTSLCTPRTEDPPPQATTSSSSSATFSSAKPRPLPTASSRIGSRGAAVRKRATAIARATGLSANTLGKVGDLAKVRCARLRRATLTAAPATTSRSRVLSRTGRAGTNAARRATEACRTAPARSGGSRCTVAKRAAVRCSRPDPASGIGATRHPSRTKTARGACGASGARARARAAAGSSHRCATSRRRP